MSQVFSAPYIYPIDRANQNKALQQAGWGGMASYGAVPNNTLQGLSSLRQAGGRGTINNYVGTFQPPTPTRPPLPSTASAFPTTNIDMAGFVSPQQAVTYSPVSPNIYDPWKIFSNIPKTSFGGNASTPVPPSGWFDDMMAKGKKFFEENKWLTGDKETVGAIPLGLGLFNALNQYTLGKERIRSMREQNALARESFAFNKEGLKAELEDKLLNRNLNQNYYVNGDKQSYADNLTSAKTKTEEEMKRFK